jgi:hypothetical protein
MEAVDSKKDESFKQLKKWTKFMSDLQKDILFIEETKHRFPVY